MLTSGRPRIAADPRSMSPLRARERRLVKFAATSCLCLAVLLGLVSLPAPAGARSGWSLTLTATPASGPAGAPATLTAVANKPLTPRLYINIWRVGRPGLVKRCRDKERCTVKVTPPGNEDPSPAPVTTDTIYRAQVFLRPLRAPTRAAFANAKVSVARTEPTCHLPACPTM